MKFNSASKQFRENRELFSDPANKPFEYNLNAGLENIASGLTDIESRVSRIEDQLNQVIQLLSRR